MSIPVILQNMLGNFSGCVGGGRRGGDGGGDGREAGAKRVRLPPSGAPRLPGGSPDGY